jgi:hypothetical protein
MINNIHIDFEVLKTKNCKVLSIMDCSNWSIAESETAYISILTPGSSIPVNNIFNKHQINLIDAVGLKLTDVTNYSLLPVLPDGIYEITVFRCVDDVKGVTKYHFQDCVIRCQLSRKLLALDLNCEPCKKELLKHIQDIWLFLDAAQAQADQCNPNKAMEYYRRAATLLDRISDGGCSPCTNCDGFTTMG